MDSRTSGPRPYEDMFRLQCDQDDGWGFGQTALTYLPLRSPPEESIEKEPRHNGHPSSPEDQVTSYEPFDSDSDRAENASRYDQFSNQPIASSIFADITPTAVDSRLPAEIYPIYFDNAFHDTLAATQIFAATRSKRSPVPTNWREASTSNSQTSSTKSPSPKSKAYTIPPAGKVSTAAYQRTAYDEEIRAFAQFGINRFSTATPAPEVEENPSKESIYDDAFLELARDVTTGIVDEVHDPAQGHEPIAGLLGTAAQKNDEDDDPLMAMSHETAAPIPKYGVSPEPERSWCLGEDAETIDVRLPSYVTDIRRIYGPWSSPSAYVAPLNPDGSSFDAKSVLKTEIIAKRVQWMTDCSRKASSGTRSRVPSVGLSIKDRTKRERLQRLVWQYVAADEMLMRGVKGIGHDSAGQEKLVLFAMGGDTLFTVHHAPAPKRPLTGYCKKLAVYQKREGTQGDESYWLGVAGQFTGEAIPEAMIKDRCQVIDMQKCMEHVMTQQEWDELRYSWEDRENFDGIPIPDEEEDKANYSQTIHPKDLMEWPSLNVLGPIGWNALEHLWADILKEVEPAENQQRAQPQLVTSSRQETQTLQDAEDSQKSMDVDGDESSQRLTDIFYSSDQQVDSEMQDESSSDANGDGPEHEVSTDSKDDEDTDYLVNVKVRWEQTALQMLDDMDSETAPSIKARISQNVFVTGEEPDVADNTPSSPAESDSTNYSRWSLETTFEPRFSRGFAPARSYRDKS